mmetsp:Transcript_38087/g.36447  ORF Transcript_38087/g.36447 Transcript_38087/m.36447 type:complete len:156 (+) Transcript_38087:475-942(+)
MVGFPIEGSLLQIPLPLHDLSVRRRIRLLHFLFRLSFVEGEIILEDSEVGSNSEAVGLILGKFNDLRVVEVFQVVPLLIEFVEVGAFLLPEVPEVVQIAFEVGAMLLLVLLLDGLRGVLVEHLAGVQTERVLQLLHNFELLRLLCVKRLPLGSFP